MDTANARKSWSADCVGLNSIDSHGVWKMSMYIYLWEIKRKTN